MKDYYYKENQGDFDEEEEEQQEEQEEIDASDQEIIDEEKNIKETLSQMPFEMLLKMRQSTEDAIPKIQKEKPIREKVNVKRSDKTGPQIRDATKRIGRHVDVVQAKKKPFTRDPRFDPLSGHLSVGLFQKSYVFLKDQKQSEVLTLQKQIKKTKDAGQKENLRQALSKNKDELKRHDMLQRKRSLVRNIRTEQHLNPNKTIVKKEMMKEKFNDLSSKGKLEQYMGHKRRKQQWKLDKALTYIQ